MAKGTTNGTQVELPLIKDLELGNMQYRFSPSAKFSTSQQVYILNAEYKNIVIDCRTREEGSDRDVTWRGAASWNPKPGHLIEFGAQAQSLNAERIDRRFTRTTEQTLINASGDTSSTAGWAQYRWTPNAKVSITLGVRYEHWQLYDQSKASPWLLSELEVRPVTRLRFYACRSTRDWTYAPIARSPIARAA